MERVLADPGDWAGAVVREQVPAPSCTSWACDLGQGRALSELTVSSATGV